MTDQEKLLKAKEIAKANGLKGSFRFCINESNSNNVDVSNEAGYYCTINVRSCKITGY